MAESSYDIIIIGGGPAGCAAALYAARAQLRVLVLDRPGRGGALAATEHIANYPGVPGPLSGAELVATMQRQAESFGAEFRTETVNYVHLEVDPKVAYAGEHDFSATVIIIASGALERKSRIPGEEAFLGRGVSECVTCDAAFYRGKTTVVAGSNDYAAEEALGLARYASKVYFMHPTDKVTMSPLLLEELRAHPQVEVRLGWRLKEIQGNAHVDTARFHTPAGEETLPIDGVFIYLGGARASTSFLRGQLALDDDGAIVTNADFATSLPRVYAVGDAVSRHVRQAVVAAAEGCIAALAAEKELRGRAKIALDYK